MFLVNHMRTSPPFGIWRACARAATARLSAILFSDDNVYAPTFHRQAHDGTCDLERSFM
jgi:hypothetical protein